MAVNFKESKRNKEGNVVYHAQDRGVARETTGKLLPTPCEEIVAQQKGFTLFCLELAVDEVQLLNRTAYTEVFNFATETIPCEVMLEMLVQDIARQSLTKVLRAMWTTDRNQDKSNSITDKGFRGRIRQCRMTKYIPAALKEVKPRQSGGPVILKLPKRKILRGQSR